MSIKTSIIFIVILLAIVGGLLWYLQNTPQGPVSDITEIPVDTTPTGLPIPEEVFAMNGEIVSVDKRGMVVSASAESNYLKENTEIEVAFDENTTFFSFTLPKTITPGEPFPGVSEQSIEVGELKVGDMVMVSSVENIQGKDTFVAEKVVIIP